MEEQTDRSADGCSCRHIFPVDTSLHWAYTLHGMSNTRSLATVSLLSPISTAGTLTSNSMATRSSSSALVTESAAAVERSRHTSMTTASPRATYGTTTTPSGITRLNVYAGLAGFYFIRDEYRHRPCPGNPLGLASVPVRGGVCYSGPDVQATTVSFSTRLSPATHSTTTSSPAKVPSSHPTSSPAAAQPPWPSSSATTWSSTA